MEEFEAAAQDKLSVFVFSANWCPDCHFITPFMPELIAKYKQIAFYYVDRDTCMDICLQLQIMGIPSFVAYSKGEEIARFVSRLRKTKDEMKLIHFFLNYRMERRSKYVNISKNYQSVI